MSTPLAIDVAAQALARAAHEPKITSDIDLVGHVEVQLAAQVGTVTLSIDRLFALKPGDVVSMNELLEEPLTLLLNGRAVARAELVAIDDYFGVRIIEVA